MLYFLLLVTVAVSWAGPFEPPVGGDVPVSPTTAPKDSSQVAPSTKSTLSSQMTAPVAASQTPNPWDSFVGDFRINLEQSPLKHFSRTEDEELKRHFRADWVFYFTPFEAFDIAPPKPDQSALRELYSFYIGISAFDDMMFLMEHQLQLPLFRSGKSQCMGGTYLSHCFFRKGNPLWTTGAMGSVGYLVRDNLMVRAGVKHPLYSYLNEDKEEAPIAIRDWRLFVSFSIGSL